MDESKRTSARIGIAARCGSVAILVLVFQLSRSAITPCHDVSASLLFWSAEADAALIGTDSGDSGTRRVKRQDLICAYCSEKKDHQETLVYTDSGVHHSACWTSDQDRFSGTKNSGSRNFCAVVLLLLSADHRTQNTLSGRKFGSLPAVQYHRECLLEHADALSALCRLDV